MKNKTLYVGLSLLLCSHQIYADNILERKLKQQSKQSGQAYIAGNSNRQLNPNSPNGDTNDLANSVEFEVFKINEDSVSHTTFKSNSGICYGFKKGGGVKLTDSATYYMVKNSQDEYYLNIAGAEIAQGKVPKEMQYVPVFNVTDQEMLKKLQEEDKTIGNKIADANVEERSKVLSNVVCK